MNIRIASSLFFVILFFGQAFAQDEIKDHFMSGVSIYAGYKLIYAGRFGSEIYAVYEPLEEGLKCVVFVGCADAHEQAVVYGYFRDRKRRLEDMSDIFSTNIGKFRFPPSWMHKFGARATFSDHSRTIILEEFIVNGKPKIKIF